MPEVTTTGITIPSDPKNQPQVRKALLNVHTAITTSVGTFSVIGYGARGDAIEIVDAAMTASSPTLSSAGSSFTTADIGKSISVRGAGTAGATLRGTIIARPSSTSLTLSLNAVTTVSGQQAVYGTNDLAAFIAAKDEAKDAAGGTVIVPAGFYYLSGQIPVDATIGFRGDGWREQITSGIASTEATRLYVGFDTSTADSVFYITAEGVEIQDIEFYATQKAAGGSWSPLTTPYAIFAYRAPFASVGGDGAKIRRIMIRNLSHGIKFIGTNRPLLEEIYGQPMVLGIYLDGIYDTARISGIHFWPFWSANSNVTDYTLANATVILCGRVDNPMISKVFAINYHKGMAFEASAVGIDPPGTTARAKISAIDFDNVWYGIYSGGGVEALVSNIDIQCATGVGNATTGSRCIYMPSSNPSTNLQISGADFSGSDLEAVRIDATDGDVGWANVWIRNWNDFNNNSTGMYFGSGITINPGSATIDPADGNGAAAYGGSPKIAGPVGSTYFTGNTGLGTITPDLKLTVLANGAANGFARFTNTDFVLASAGSGVMLGAGANSGDTYSTISAYTGGFSAWGNLVMQQGGGKVGIGRVPAYKLDVNGGSIASQLHVTSSDVDSGGYLTSASANNLFVSSGAAFNGTNWVAKSTVAAISGGASGFFRVFTDTGLTAGSTFTPTQRFEIDTSGNASITGTLKISNLTSGRVPIISTSGLVTDDADLTFSTDTLTSTKLVGSTNVLTPLLTASASLNIAPTNNLGLWTTSFGTSANKVLAFANGTDPTTLPSGVAQMWVHDMVTDLVTTVTGTYTPSLGSQLYVWAKGFRVMCHASFGEGYVDQSTGGSDYPAMVVNIRETYTGDFTATDPATGFSVAKRAGLSTFIKFNATTSGLKLTDEGYGNRGLISDISAAGITHLGKVLGATGEVLVGPARMNQPRGLFGQVQVYNGTGGVLNGIGILGEFWTVSGSVGTVDAGNAFVSNVLLDGATNFTTLRGYLSDLTVNNTTITVGAFYHFRADVPTLASGSLITYLAGFDCFDQSGITGVATAWNYRSRGSASKNSFEGLTSFGSTSAPVSKVSILAAPTASANFGTISIGSGPFDGSTSGFFAGLSAGTHIAINAASGSTADMLDCQIAGVPSFKVTNLGNLTISNSAPSITLFDTTASAKYLAIAVDSNLAQFRESAGAAGSLVVLDLTNNRLGVGVASPLSKFHVEGGASSDQFRFGDGSGNYYVMGRNNAVTGFLDFDGSQATFTGYTFKVNNAIGASTTIFTLTNPGVVKIGGTALRGTTEGTKRLDIFDGTDPVGTLANGISLFSSSGYANIKNAAGVGGKIVATSSVNSVSPTAPNRTLTVDIGGVTLYIHCKTTND